MVVNKINKYQKEKARFAAPHLFPSYYECIVIWMLHVAFSLCCMEAWNEVALATVIFSRRVKLIKSDLITISHYIRTVISLAGRKCHDRAMIGQYVVIIVV